ncbi:MAG: VWA-like domain-containing protein [Lachnospiraceae bacterium]|nr:VWA-like domain-containing protein [Lachnospiraceae bacterium]
MAIQYDIIAKLDGVCSNILTSSRNEIYLHMRYLGMAFNGLKYAMSNSTDTVGTDGFYFYYAPAFLMETYRKNEPWIKRGYVHMIFHCIFKHLINMGDRDMRLWNVSCDIVTEMLVDGLDIRLLRRNSSSIRKMVYSEIKENIKVPTAESVYRYLEENQKLLSMIEKIEDEFIMDDHQFWLQYQNSNQPMGGGGGNGDGQNGDGENENNDQNSGNGDGKSDNMQPPKNAEDFKDKWQNISEKTQTDMETFSREMSDEAGSFTEYLGIENRQRYDYRSFLQKFTVLREVMQLDLDSYDYIYYTYGLKVYGNMPLIESLEYSDIKKVEEFVIVIDTSASCETELVRIFLEETYSILKDNESFFRKINSHIIQCDTKVQDDKIIVCPEDFEQYMTDFEIKGRGGTDFTAAFDYVNALCEEKKINELKGLIYFTDGCGTYPKNMPLYEVAFVFVSERFDDKGVPPWAVEIILGKDDIYELKK